ncbi:hypothetical protein HETIRDRAFT_165217 [Heterobasidion irregulare TC 32-1]|uniref:Uncharacterized protein n=1 Tax=Heterobasidion irregulare (strain TC 32-1) TaxID=747525 RepID=W4KBG4_HETIT|nr:uncharacterized protein HETIRDRAFT_165217 [Heterobasidion irregulare TC 32-1]XP_009553012.1 uncharacterized protein HETIRDRAFT_423263 [Heterobasidion irregulare TC 32-1]ETW75616.1 hypothetical protein HETIRDRAFT_423263 [Heterobasidion irregulare TC 32-1]ETW82396.1 hypothetical protein HETIRDRAFT_165217 [Heterobasidion irregulare TC 32-1]
MSWCKTRVREPMLFCSQPGLTERGCRRQLGSGTESQRELRIICGRARSKCADVPDNSPQAPITNCLSMGTDVSDDSAHAGTHALNQSVHMSYSCHSSLAPWAFLVSTFHHPTPLLTTVINGGQLDGDLFDKQNRRQTKSFGFKRCKLGMTQVVWDACTV